MKPGLRRVTPTLRRLAGNPGASRPSRWSNLPTDQINLTDEESRIVLVAGGSFEQCYNAQTLVVVLTGADFPPDLPATIGIPAEPADDQSLQPAVLNQTDTESRQSLWIAFVW
jgi:hypothetical protein